MCPQEVFFWPHSALLELSANQIDLWLAHVDALCDPGLVQRYGLLLSAEELCRAARFHFPKDRHRCVVTRALVRTVLSRYAPLTPKQWVFSTNAHGKPAIANEDRLAQRIAFNVSHSNGLIVLGVSGGAALGVDVEHVLRRRPTLEASDAIFSAAEISAIAALADSERQQRFFQFWTLKEAYLKACGTGMSVAPNKVSFEFLAQERVQLSLHESLPGPASRWHFWQFRPTADHVLSVCADQGEVVVQRCTFRQVVPLVGEQLIDCAAMLDSMV